MEETVIVGDLDKQASAGHFDPYTLSPAEQVAVLQNKVVRLVFRKADNTKRVAYATRNPELINIYMDHGSSLSVKEAEKRYLQASKQPEDTWFDINTELSRGYIKFFDLTKRSFRTYKPLPKDNNYVEGSRLLHADVNELGEFLFPSWVEFDTNSANWFALTVVPYETALQQGVNTDEAREDPQLLAKYIKKSDERHATSRVTGSLSQQKASYEQRLANEAKATIKAQDQAYEEDLSRENRLRQCKIDNQDMGKMLNYWKVQYNGAVITNNDYMNVVKQFLKLTPFMDGWELKSSNEQMALGILIYHSAKTDDDYVLSPNFIANITLGHDLYNEPISYIKADGTRGERHLINYRRPVLLPDFTEEEQLESSQLRQLIKRTPYQNGKLLDLIHKVAGQGPFVNLNKVSEKDVKQIAHLWVYANESAKESNNAKHPVTFMGAPNQQGGFTGNLRVDSGQGMVSTWLVELTANSVTVKNIDVANGETYRVDKTKSTSYGDQLMKLMEMSKVPRELTYGLGILRKEGMNLRKKLPNDNYVKKLVTTWKPLL